MDNNEQRELLIALARAKYIDTGITRNITEALRMYLENDAGPDEQIPLFITSPEIHRLRTVLKHVRPRCDDCDSELLMHVNARDPDGKIYPTAWVCKNCGIEYYSDKSPEEWLKELRVEAREQNISNHDEFINASVPAGRQTPEI